jgi:hypothetical protein
MPGPSAAHVGGYVVTSQQGGEGDAVGEMDLTRRCRLAKGGCNEAVPMLLVGWNNWQASSDTEQGASLGERSRICARRPHGVVPDSMRRPRRAEHVEG